MKKKVILLGMTIIAIINLLIIPIQAVNFWGTESGDSRVYMINEIYSGNITGSTEYPTYQYSILNNYDTDSDNRTDVNLHIKSLTPEYSFDQINIKTSYSFLAQNDPEPYYFNNFIFNDIDTFSTIASYAEGGYYLLPTNPGNYTASWFIFIWLIDSYGVNWTRAVEQLNNRSDLTQYNATWEDNLMIINCTKENQTDLNLNKNYTLTKQIVWDNTTGFLLSFEMIKSYDNSFYSIKSTITSQSSYSDQPVIILEVKDIFWPIGLTLCSIAAIFSLIVFSKTKKES
ncbi:MAG: hypothetical protein GF329_08840 [Candidatus Lokiarchaeota archaeon]|nr:hypothetical protein [Candidatus Lokiarchaeota archaeon]